MHRGPSVRCCGSAMQLVVHPDRGVPAAATPQKEAARMAGPRACTAHACHARYREADCLHMQGQSAAGAALLACQLFVPGLEGPVQLARACRV